MAMFVGYFKVSVNFNVENRREKFIILIIILNPIYRILIRYQNLLCFPRELLMSFLSNEINIRFSFFELYMAIMQITTDGLCRHYLNCLMLII